MKHKLTKLLIVVMIVMTFAASFVACGGIPVPWLDTCDHDWEEPTFTWQGDTATATAVCKKDASHTEEVKASVTEETAQGANCSIPVLRTYTATAVIDGTTYTDVKTVTVAAEHQMAGSVCSVCGPKRVDENGNSDSSGNYILFGSYPQSAVEGTLAATLTQLTGTPVDGSHNAMWTSYGYYIAGSNTTDYMWYTDISHNGEQFRGVYFSSYRPFRTNYSSSSGNSFQYDNGYTTAAVYWFRYEPIRWRILTEENGRALLLCEMLIDSQAYQNTYVSSKGVHHATDDAGNILVDANGNQVYADNYAYSTIRSWLNETFINTAFSEMQQNLIATVTVDNSASTTYSSSNLYACDNTEDKVFLLSYQDVYNSAYGFTHNTERKKQTTDYAQCQGAQTSTSSSYAGNGNWWLRSPHHQYSGGAGVVLNGCADYYGVNVTYSGVCPAIWIPL